MGALRKLFFNYDAHLTWWKPVAAPVVRPTFGRMVERVDIDTGDNRYSVLIGDRNYIDVEFRWMTQANLDYFRLFWDAVKDGARFDFGEDDTVPNLSTGIVCGDGTVCGETDDGSTQVRYICVMDSIDPGIYPDEVYGYYGAGFRMRVIEAINE